MVNPFNLSITQQKTIFWVQKIPAFFSILCSLHTIFTIIYDKRRRNKIFHRIMVAFNINCFIFSLGYFCGSWPIKSSYPLYGASGNQGTCDIQGFIIMFTFFTICFYYILLSLFAYISVKNNFDETSFLKYEYRIHTIIHIIPLILSVVALNKEYFNPVISSCLVSSYPQKCSSGEQFGKCTRGGDGFDKFSLVIAAMILIALVLPVFLFIKLYFTVRQIEKRNIDLIGKQKFREHARKYKSRIIAKQALMYCASFYVTIFLSSLVLLKIRFSDGNVSFGWIIIVCMCPSMIGTLNLIVYQRLLNRQLGPHESFNLAPLAERVTMAGLFLTIHADTFSRCNLKQCDPPPFSIFDGTNPSDSDIGQFVDEWSDNDKSEAESEVENGNDENRDSDIE